MAGKTQHTIAKLTWNTLFDEKNSAFSLQEKISDWSKINFSSETNEIFNKICPDDQIWRIRTLTLDLGKIDITYFEEETSKKIKQALQNVLYQLVLTQDTAHKNFEVVSIKKSLFETLEVFLTTGMSPWSFSKHHEEPNDILGILLKKQPRNTLHMLYQAGTTNINVRKRMAWQFSEKNIKTIIKGFEPGHYQEIIDFSEEIASIQTKQTLIQTSGKEFKRNLWHWIFNHLLTERGTIFNTLNFIESSLKQMANHYNIAYAVLLQMVQDALKKFKAQHETSKLLYSLQTLSKQEQSVQTNSSPNVTPKSLINSLDLILQKQEIGAITSKELNSLLCAYFQPNKHHTVTTFLPTLAHYLNTWNFTSRLTSKTLGALLDVKTCETDFITSPQLRSLYQLLLPHFPNIEKRTFYLLALKQLTTKNKNTLPLNGFFDTLFIYLSQTTHEKRETTCIKIWSVCFYSPLKTKLVKRLFKYTQKQIEIQSINNTSNAWAFQQKARTQTNALTNATTITNKTIHAWLNALYQLKKINTSHAFAYNPRFNVYSHKKDVANNAFLDFLTKDYCAEIHDFLKSCTKQNKAQHFITSIAKSNQYHNLIHAFGNDLKSYVLQFLEACRIVGISSIIISQLKHLILELYYIKKKNSVTTHSNALFECLPAHLPLALIEKLFTHFGKPESIYKSWYTSFLQHSNEMFLKQPISGKIQLYLNEKTILAKFIAQNTENSFIRHLPNNPGSIKRKVLNALLPNGEGIYQTMLLHYVKTHHKTLTHIPKTNLSTIIHNLFWQCAFDYNSYKGNTSLFKKTLHCCVSIYFLKLNHTAQKNKIKSLPAPSPILYTETDLLNLFTLENSAASFKTVFNTIIEHLNLNLTQLFTCLNKIPNYSHKIEQHLGYVQWLTLCSQRIPLSRLALVDSLEKIYVISASKSTQDHSCIYPLYTLTEELLHSGSASTKTLKLFSKKVVKHKGIEQIKFQKHVQNILKQANSFTQPTLPFTQPSPNATGALKNKNQTLKAMLAHEHVLDTLLIHFTHHHSIQACFLQTLKLSRVKIIEVILKEYPHDFLRALTKVNVDMHYCELLNSTVSFERLVQLLQKTYGAYASQLNAIYDIYSVVVSLGKTNDLHKKLPGILYFHLLQTALTGNWKNLQSQYLWNELAWKFNFITHKPSNTFIGEIEKIAFALPLSLQVSFKKFTPSQTLIKKELPLKLPKINVSNHQNEIEKTGITVNNAGLVLLNSYFELLFNRLGLIANNCFKSIELAQTGAHILQYIATGHTQTSEHYLTLNKVLCGISLNEPIVYEVEITHENKELIHGLLQAAIGYWPAAGDTSVNGFRGNWLVRNGILYEHTDKYELIVEKRPYDLLIQKSPFSFSIVKHPWMQKPLHVTWPN